MRNLVTDIRNNKQKFVIALLAIIACTNVFGDSFGTGFYVSSDGHIVTNAHVVEGAERILIKNTNGTELPAKLLSIDKNNDLALLKAETSSKPLHIRSTDGVDKGSKVFTIGFPNPTLQGLEPKYTDGAISSFSGLRDKPNVMQITVPIQPGNSGGPLLDNEGNVIGIIVSKLNPLAVIARQEYIPENVNFAIKSDYLLPLISSIKSGNRGQRAKSYTVKSLESSVVLIETFSNLSTEKLKPAPSGTTKNNDPEKTHPTRRITTIAPDTIENGCVTPIGFSVIPPLGAEDTAIIKVDGVPAVSINVINGTLREFQYRIRLSRPSTLTVECPGCIGDTFTFKSLKIGCSENRQQSPIGSIRMLIQDDTFRSLIEGSYPSSNFLITGPKLTTRITTTPSTVLNPFIMIKSESRLEGQYCIKISTPFDVKENCSQ